MTRGAAHTAARALCDKTPDPVENEAKFFKFMQANAQKVTSASKDVEKEISCLEGIAAADTLKDVDSENLMQAAKQTADDSTFLIEVYALLTFIRNPRIRNPECELRPMLAEIVQQMEAKGSRDIIPTFVEEAKAIVADLVTPAAPAKVKPGRGRGGSGRGRGSK